MELLVRDSILTLFEKKVVYNSVELYWSSCHSKIKYNTLSMFYKRQPIRDGRQILEKNKRQSLAFSEKLRDNPGQILETIKRHVHAHSYQTASEITTASKQLQM